MRQRWAERFRSNLRSRVELWAVPLAVCLLDKTLTMLGQTPRYWDGEYHRVHEANPLMRPLLEIHPASYTFGSLLYVLLWILPVILLPKRLAIVLSVWVTIAHTQGARTWMYNVFDIPYLVHNSLNLIVAFLLVWSWTRTENRP